MEEQYVATPAELEARRPALPRVRLSAAAREKLLYACAAVSYVAIGVFFTPLVEFWMFGFAWLLAWVCGLPALVRLLRRRQ